MYIYFGPIANATTNSSLSLASSGILDVAIAVLFPKTKFQLQVRPLNDSLLFNFKYECCQSNQFEEGLN